MPQLYLLDLCNELDTGSKSNNLRSGSLLKPQFLIIKNTSKALHYLQIFLDTFSNVRHSIDPAATVKLSLRELNLFKLLKLIPLLFFLSDES